MGKIGLDSSSNNDTRVVYEDWNQITSVLGPYAISNYVQLFFALINDPDLCNNPALVNIFAEIQFNKECIEKKKKEKEKIRNVSNNVFGLVNNHHV